MLFLSQALKLAWASPSQQRALESYPGRGLRSKESATLNLLEPSFSPDPRPSHFDLSTELKSSVLISILELRASGLSAAGPVPGAPS